jgi:hypothetical protein
MPSPSSADSRNHVNNDVVSTENVKERNIGDSSVDKITEKRDESMPQDKSVEVVEEKSCMDHTDIDECNQTKHSEPTCSKTPAKHKRYTDVTNCGELSDKRNGKASYQRTCFVESDGHITANSGPNVEPHLDNGPTAMLSTPMLNIVDYLPPEIMHNLQGNLSNKLSYSNSNGSTSSDSMDNVFATSDIDCLYYPASCDLSLQNHVLSDCENETLSNISNFPFELHRSDSYSCGIPTTAEAERLKDIVGFISSQNTSSTNLLHNLAFSNVPDNENVISACSSEDGENVVNSLFKDVGLNISGQEENTKSGLTLNTQSSMLASVVSHDVLAPEVILESHTCNAEQAADAGSGPEAVEPSKKKSKKCGVHQRKKGERYLPHFKVKVLAYAASHTLRETAKKFKVNDGTISSWKKEEEWKKHLAKVCIVAVVLIYVITCHMVQNFYMF